MHKQSLSCLSTPEKRRGLEGKLPHESGILHESPIQMGRFIDEEKMVSFVLAAMLLMTSILPVSAYQALDNSTQSQPHTEFAGSFHLSHTLMTDKQAAVLADYLQNNSFQICVAQSLCKRDAGTEEPQTLSLGFLTLFA